MSIKPKLKSSSKIVDLPDGVRPTIQNSNPLFSYETVGWGPIVVSWAKSISLFVAFALVLALVLYAGLAATIAYGIKIEDKYYGVARDTFVGNVIPAGENVYASASTPIDSTLTAKLIEGGKILIGQQALEDAVEVKVIAGPTMKIAIGENNTTTILSGKNSGEVIIDPITGLKSDVNLIKDDYIVECLWGACEEGELFLIPASNISGKIIDLDKGKN
jgi:hypothetical protein